jgi:pyruvate-formate lyase
MPVPFIFSMLEGCIEISTDMTAGGTDYYCTSLIAISGMSNLEDSLSAVRKLVFEEKKLDMKSLLNALDKNF